MSLALAIVKASRASSTHHKLALDALAHLQCENAQRWRDVFLVHHEAYLEGAKAPDAQFKDFVNHVCHVGDGYWGGAPKAARAWKDRAVALFAAGEWSQGVYAAGVMSHYYVDPLQPFHTAQSEAEGAIHRAVEWSFNKAYEEMKRVLETDLGGYVDIAQPAGEDWMEAMTRAGAAAAYPHYDAIIDHYDLARGKNKPAEGLDQDIKDRVARLIGHAIIGLSRVLERVFAEAHARPPKVNAAPAALLASLDTPRQWVLRKIEDAGERRAVAAMYAELQTQGKVIDHLPEDDAEVRRVHAEEVLKVPMTELDARPARRPGALHDTNAPSRRRDMFGNVHIARARLAPSFPRFQTDDAPPVRAQAKRAAASDAAAAAPRFRLSYASPVVDAPSIGPKTAARLEAVEVRTVGDLLNGDPAKIAEGLGARYITPALVIEWQDQARLVARVPDLRGTDAQVLVACGVRSAEALAVADIDALVADATAFAQTPQGKRVLRSMPAPDRERVTGWVERAQHARVLEAA